MGVRYGGTRVGKGIALENWRMKFVLLPLGSAGDVHPLVWVAKVLAGRGHEVCMVAQAMVAEIPRRAGLRTIEVGTREEQEKVVKNPDLWHPKKGFQILAERFPHWAREMLPAIKAEIDAGPGETVLIAGGIALAGRMASEAWGVPCVTVHLQPSAFLSVEASPVMAAGLEWLPKMPRWVRRILFGMIHREVDRALARRVNEVRKELGLREAVRGIFREYWMSPDGVLALFPEWFAAKQKDWPEQAVTTRFPLYDEAGERGVDAELEEFFVECGAEKPVLFTPGSANLHAEEFFAVAAGACERMGRRGLLVTQYPEQVKRVPRGCRMFEYVPFSATFSRCAAVVHHGGVGTCAQGLAAGVPQLLMAMAHDQPDNGGRLRRMGVGDYVYPKKFTAERVAEKVEGLVRSSAVAAACAKYKKMMGEQMGREEFGKLVEGLGERGLRRRGS